MGADVDPAIKPYDIHIHGKDEVKQHPCIVGVGFDPATEKYSIKYRHLVQDGKCTRCKINISIES